MSEPRLVDDILELAAIPAPTFAEEPRLAWLEERLRTAPGDLRRDATGNLIWSWGEGRPVVALLAHVDTVFPAETPLSFRHENGRLTGPGVGDNAAAVAVVVHASRDVLDRRPEQPLAVAFTVGEEGLGNLRGAVQACRELQPRAVVAVEGHGLEQVIVDAVGSVRFRIALGGPGGHSWVDRGRPSAIHELIRVGADLLAHATRETPVNLGTMTGGQSVNTIAGAAEVVVEMRALDEEPLQAFADRVQALSVPAPLEIEVEEVGRRPAGRLDRGSELLRVVERVRANLRLPQRLGAGSTDANAALAAGIPALTLGCSDGAGMHTLAEWIDAGSLSIGRRQLRDVILGLVAP